MKKSLLIILIFAFFSSITYSQSGWVQQVSNTTKMLRSIFFINENTGWIVGAGQNNDQIVIKTTNGGINWNTIHLVSGADNGFSSVIFINENTGFVASKNGSLYKSINGGNNWYVIYNGTIGLELYSTYFIDNNTGYAGGYQKFIMTVNGGANWYIPPELQGLYNASISFYNNYSGYVCGKDLYSNSGTIYKTTTGGISWDWKYSSTYNDIIYGISCPDPNKVVAVNSNGKIILSTNGGSNWTVVNSGFTSQLTSIHMCNTNTGYSVGSPPDVIIKTTNGGYNWYQQNSPVNSGLFGVFFLNDKTGYICGGNGLILKTTSGGDSVPAAPTLVSPLNNSNNLSLTPTLVWNSVTGVLNYQVQVSKFSNFNPIIDSATVATNQYQIPNGKLTVATTYFWRVAARNTAGIGPWSEIWNFTTVPTVIKQINFEVPKSFNLSQNYPNPFNPTTKFKFDIPKSTNIKLIVYNSLGQEISILANEKVSPGTYETEFNGDNYPSGVYFYKLITNDFSESKKMLLIK